MGRREKGVLGRGYRGVLGGGGQEGAGGTKRVCLGEGRKEEGERSTDHGSRYITLNAFIEGVVDTKKSK
jgi:hypothetical protein